MSSLPARIKKLKIKALECSQDSSHYKTMGFFPANSAVHCRIRSNFKIVCDFMVVHVTWKNEEEPIKNEEARVVTRYVDFSGAQGQITPKSVVESGRKFLCMCLLPARMKKIQSKMKSLEWPQHFSHYKSMGIFRFAQGQLTPHPLV